MAANGYQEKLEYILHVLSETDLPQPNFAKIAQNTGQTTASNAQRRFKAVIESMGYNLVNKQIVLKGASGANDTTPATPVKKSSKANPKKAPGSGTKRKIDLVDDKSTEGYPDNSDDDGSKKARSATVEEDT